MGEIQRVAEAKRSWKTVTVNLDRSSDAEVPRPSDIEDAAQALGQTATPPEVLEAPAGPDFDEI